MVSKRVAEAECHRVRRWHEAPDPRAQNGAQRRTSGAGGRALPARAPRRGGKNAAPPPLPAGKTGHPRARNAAGPSRHAAHKN